MLHPRYLNFFCLILFNLTLYTFTLLFEKHTLTSEKILQIRIKPTTNPFRPEITNFAF